ncbi:hypothetical protein PRVXH_000558 [Proteinivorax hydrogeniformans]|uniref:Serine/threonine protein kinase n=1 Tax=Proteinivorax hydrogeniformans TaxID=1826727 RepID=A0AAU8HV51_9FIRM
MEQDFTKIKVYPGKKKVRYENPTNLKFIGRGYTGAVFKLSNTKCVKIYVEQKKAKDEAKALRTGQDSPIMPKLYDVGSNYIVMEYIRGPSLSSYLKKTKELPNHLSKQILFCLKELDRLGFPRTNVHVRHFIIANDNKLKVIDHANVYKELSKKPTYLLRGLRKLGLLNDFMEYVKKADPKTYNDWVSY